MQRHLLILLLLFLSISCFSQVQKPCVMDIVERHDTVFKAGEQKPYNGKYEEYYPGNIKISGNYLNGLKHGQFIYFGNHVYDSIVNFSFGHRDGLKQTYEADGYLESKLNFLNDTLDGQTYYWTRGQLYYSEIYKKGKLISSQAYPYNDSIKSLIFYLPCEHNGKISRKQIESQDSIQIKLCGIICSNASDIDYECDTIQLDKSYKVVSFDISGWGTDSSVHSNSCFIKGSAKRMMLYSSFGIDILIEAFGVQYEIPGRIIKTTE